MIPTTRTNNSKANNEYTELRQNVRFGIGKITSFCLLICIGILDSILDLYKATDHSAISVLYICCILLVSYESRKTIIVTYFVVLALIAIDFLVITVQNKPTISIELNAIISIIASTIATYLVMKHNELEEKTLQEKQEYINSLKAMLYMTSHKVRNPICSLQGIMDLTKDGNEHTLQQYYNEVNDCVARMDKFTRELTSFISDIDKKQTNNEPGGTLQAA